jgi:hypothetical protein
MSARDDDPGRGHHHPAAVVLPDLLDASGSGQLGAAPDPGQVERTIASAFAEVFRLNPISASLDARGPRGAAGAGPGLPRRRRTDAVDQYRDTATGT